MTAPPEPSAAYLAGVASVASNPPPPVSEAQAADIRCRLGRLPDPGETGKEGGEAA